MDGAKKFQTLQTCTEGGKGKGNLSGFPPGGQQYRKGGGGGRALPLGCISPEGQKAPNSHVHQCGLVPGLWRDFTSNVLGAARSIEGTCTVLAEDAPNHSEREAHQQPNRKQEQDGGGRQRLRRPVGPVH